MRTEEKRLYGLIGKNISYSFSPDYFRKKFDTLKLPTFQYEIFDLPDLTQFEEILNLENLSGLNVTIPYKESILPHLGSLSKKAQKIGAVNTIRILKNGTTKGYNTDWYGFKESLVPLLQPQHTKALILGKGGASKAIAYALKKLGISYAFVTRQEDEHYSYSDVTPELLQEFQLVINTTPLGTHPNIEHYPDIDYSGFTSDHLAYDLIYNPEKTEFLKRAEIQGAQIKNGLEMLELQAEKAWKIWNKI